MDELIQSERRRSPGRDFFHSVILEQRGATEELKAICRELQTLLDDVLTARPELRPAYDELLIEQQPSDLRTSQPKTPPLELTPAQLKRDAERNLVKSRELVVESAQVRLRSKALRAAVRGSTARHIRTVTEGLNGSSLNEARHDGLSRREFEVLHLIVGGKSSKEVAAALGISFKTAVTHRASIMSKLGVHEIASVVREAIHRGLV
jgi:DNA-binding CsgD family transcriptional regulator